ncbi:hypothetical protein BBJ28_00012462 [Nothophytophthora sp. Chile5]|nr:hypothetical protein BBJ28_00012462 [Nothophytophthora sp. Chile5]
MALLVASTLVSGGLLGVAGFFVWRKGLFRKRYAALFGNEIYTEDDVACDDDQGVNRDLVPLLGDPSPNAHNPEVNPQDEGLRAQIRKSLRKSLHRSSQPSTQGQSQTQGQSDTASGVAGDLDAPVGGTKAAQHGSMAFRLFEFDPKKQQLVFSSVGLPVRFGAPLVVVHAETSRAIKYASHRGAVTISKPPVNLHFNRQVRASLFALEESSVQLNSLKKPRPQSLTTPLFPSNPGSDGVFGSQSTPNTLRATVAAPPATTDGVTRSQDDGQEVTFPYEDSDLAGEDSTVRNQIRNQMQTQVLTSYPRGGRHAKPLASLAGVTTNRQRRRHQQQSSRALPYSAQRHSLDQSSSTAAAFRALTDGDVTRPTALSHDGAATVTVANGASSTRSRRRASSSSASAIGGSGRGQPFYRSISESYMNMVSDLSDTLQQQRDRQRDRHELRRRQKRLMKDLPNMSFNTHAGKYYVASVQPVRHQLSGSNYRLPVAPRDEYLRWGQPMSLVAKFNGRGCGIRPREYYKDSDLYLTTEASPTTIVPLREDGDLKCMAKESTRCLAHLEKRQVKLSVGTYNVWMMPRKVSAFTSVSPKKNTRARLIADVLPACDVWILTECFDHRARGILLDKLADAGYFFFSPTVGHKRMNKANMRKMLNGGVVLASKYPILSVRIKLFDAACAGADKLADKGVLYCKILKDGLLVHVFSTHLQAWNDPLSRSMRKAQMEIMADFMRAMDIDPVNDAVLFAGDLNVNYWLNKTNEEYDEMLAIFEAKDPSVVKPRRLGATLSTSGKPHAAAELKHARKFSFDPRVNALAAEGLSTDGSLELLDYILYSSAHRQPSEATSWIQPLTTSTPWFWRKQPQYNLSDHFPVVSEFSFDM